MRREASRCGRRRAAEGSGERPSAHPREPLAGAPAKAQIPPEATPTWRTARSGSRGWGTRSFASRRGRRRGRRRAAGAKRAPGESSGAAPRLGRRRGRADRRCSHRPGGALPPRLPGTTVGGTTPAAQGVCLLPVPCPNQSAPQGRTDDVLPTKKAPVGNDTLLEHIHRGSTLDAVRQVVREELAPYGAAQRRRR
jgi:hypothetical protein